MPLEVLQRNIILSRFLLMSKDLYMWRIANKAWFHHDNPTSFALTQLSSVIPNFLLLVRLQAYFTLGGGRTTRGRATLDDIGANIAAGILKVYVLIDMWAVVLEEVSK